MLRQETQGLVVETDRSFSRWARMRWMSCVIRPEETGRIHASHTTQARRAVPLSVVNPDLASGGAPQPCAADIIGHACGHRVSQRRIRTTPVPFPSQTIRGSTGQRSESAEQDGSPADALVLVVLHHSLPVAFPVMRRCVRVFVLQQRTTRSADCNTDATRINRWRARVDHTSIPAPTKLSLIFASLLLWSVHPLFFPLAPSTPPLRALPPPLPPRSSPAVWHESLPCPEQAQRRRGGVRSGGR